MLATDDLIKLGELVQLAAETARAFSGISTNGELTRIADIADRMTAAAEELMEIGKELARRAS